MFGFGRKQAADTRLTRALADYPAWAPPYRGHCLKLSGNEGPMLTPTQARENFDAYRAIVPARIAALRPALAALDLAVDDAYADAAGFVLRLHPALLTALPPLYRPELGKRNAWELSDRAGDAIVLTFMADLAMLTGDVLIRANPGAFWGMNLDPRDRTMMSRCRPCLLGLADRLFPDSGPIIFFLEEEWFGYYANMDRPARLAPPEPRSGHWMGVIGGTLPERLERYEAAPDIAERRATGWMKDAA